MDISKLTLDILGLFETLSSDIEMLYHIPPLPCLQAIVVL